ncbi:uncharacterized protein Pyn_36332 [Prunus yedoensis var. nudiflora]|uniref:Uncharacterized protein n=1 Tax=Prunus yedoensis var. nudiflora TaxID=2094558 RepID=A0A314YIF5_PRUYE|nr:uncharacterized protein Pyn_36332 [Prunus yedoensis var. nudiflora]
MHHNVIDEDGRVWYKDYISPRFTRPVEEAVRGALLNADWDPLPPKTSRGQASRLWLGRECRLWSQLPFQPQGRRLWGQRQGLWCFHLLHRFDRAVLTDEVPVGEAAAAAMSNTEAAVAESISATAASVESPATILRRPGGIVFRSVSVWLYCDMLVSSKIYVSF